MRYRFGGLIFGGAFTWRGLFSEFYCISETLSQTETNFRGEKKKTVRAVSSVSKMLLNAVGVKILIPQCKTAEGDFSLRNLTTFKRNAKNGYRLS